MVRDSDGIVMGEIGVYDSVTWHQCYTSMKPSSLVLPIKRGEGGLNEKHLFNNYNLLLTLSRLRSYICTGEVRMDY